MYTASLIRSFDTTAIYLNTDTSASNPVAWALMYPNGTIAQLYVMEEHRRKGLARIVLQEMCKKIIARGDLPQTGVVVSNHTSLALMKKCGFVALLPDSQYTVRLVYLEEAVFGGACNIRI